MQHGEIRLRLRPHPLQQRDDPGAQRLEKRQNKNYGSLPEYQAYVKKTPILVPFIPVYHLVKEK